MQIVSKDADNECVLWGGVTLMQFEGQGVLALVLHNKAALNLALKSTATFSLLTDLPSIEAHSCSTWHWRLESSEGSQ